jgi:hypothetical protein
MRVCPPFHTLKGSLLTRRTAHFWRTLCCGFLATLAVVASAPFAHAAARPATQWRAVFRARTAELASVAASGPRSAWAAGFTSDPSYVMHWNGRAWRRMPLLPAHFQVSEVAGTSESDVWVSGHTAGIGRVYRWNGRHWQLMVPRIGPVALLPISPDDVWVEGESGFLLHWDGVIWQRLQFQRGVTTWPWEFAVVGQQLWQAANGVVAGRHRLVIRQWTGASWQTVPAPHPALSARTSVLISAASATNVWVELNEPAPHWRSPLLHWDGKKWTTLRTPADPPFPNYPIAAVGRSSVWIGGGFALWSGGGWHRSNVAVCAPPVAGSLVGVPGTTSALCAGDNGGPPGRPTHGVIYQAGPLP